MLVNPENTLFEDNIDNTVEEHGRLVDTGKLSSYRTLLSFISKT